jgi:putative peptidoglycan lipid II flippase
MARIMCFSPFILGISSFIGSIIQAQRKFVIYAMTPVFYNLGTIIGILYLYPKFGFKGLAWGVVLGSLMHLGIQIPTFLKSDLIPKIKFGKLSKDVTDLLKSSIPRTIEAVSGQLNVSIIIAIAGLMSAGAVSIFSLSYALQAVTISLIGASYALAAFPAMTSSYARGDLDGMIKKFLTAARHIIFWTAPAAILFIVLRAQIVRTIFGTGNFSWEDTRLVAASLAIFSISMVPQALNLLFIKSFYAASKTWIPLIISLISTITIPILAISYLYIYENSIISLGILESILRVDNIENINILLLPLAMTTVVFIQTILLYFVFVKEFRPIFSKLRRIIFHSLVSSIVMGFVLYYGLGLFEFFSDSDTAIGVFLQGLFAGIIGIISWILILMLLGNKEIKSVWKITHSKIWKSKPFVEVDNTMK